jgi:peptidoglycan LD-endopeptidase CwlK
MIQSNPERPTPHEIAAHIIEVEVEYLNFENEIKKGVIEINKHVERDVRDFFSLALAEKFPVEKVVRSSEYGWDDDKLLEANATSGFNYRFIKDTATPSLHGLGLAIDVNTRLNPYIRFKDGETYVDPPGATYDPDMPGTLTPDHPLVLLMKSRGWEWGGDWTKESGRVDYQHFQKSMN